MGLSHQRHPAGGLLLETEQPPPPLLPDLLLAPLFFDPRLLAAEPPSPEGTD